MQTEKRSDVIKDSETEAPDDRQHRYYTTIVNFLKKHAQLGAKFFILRANKELKAIHFDPDQLTHNQGKGLVKFLLTEEQKGSKILISHPDKGLKKVSFLRKNG